MDMEGLKPQPSLLLCSVANSTFYWGGRDMFRYQAAGAKALRVESKLVLFSVGVCPGYFQH